MDEQKARGVSLERSLSTASVPDTRSPGAASRDRTDEPLDYETNATTNCAIAADQALVVNSKCALKQRLYLTFLKVAFLEKHVLSVIFIFLSESFHLDTDRETK